MQKLMYQKNYICHNQWLADATFGGRLVQARRDSRILAPKSNTRLEAISG
jgi:hypothetical protein